MDHSVGPSTYDRDLDRQPQVWSNPAEPIDPYRRLLANPLLAVADCVGAIVFIRVALQHRALMLFLLGLVLLFAAGFLVQFHCLDCGTTGWLLTARRHACSPLLARWREGRPGRWRFPGLKIQMVLWLHLLASITGLLLILFAFSR